MAAPHPRSDTTEEGAEGCKRQRMRTGHGHCTHECTASMVTYTRLTQSQGRVNLNDEKGKIQLTYVVGRDEELGIFIL